MTLPHKKSNRTTLPVSPKLPDFTALIFNSLMRRDMDEANRAAHKEALAQAVASMALNSPLSDIISRAQTFYEFLTRTPAIKKTRKKK